MSKRLKLLIGICLILGQIQAQNITVNGNIATNTTWDIASIDTVKIVGNTTVNDGVSLIIEPGIVVDFTGHYYFNVEGNLFAVGSASDSIFFLASDTTGYYNNSHTGWSGLRFYNQLNDSSNLAYCSIQYGKADGTYGIPNSDYAGGIFCSSSYKVYVSHVSIKNNYASALGGGMYSYKSYPATVSNNVFSHSEFNNNKARNAGGAFYTDYDFNLHFDSCLFLKNEVEGYSSPRGGGAIASSSPTQGDHPEISNSRFGYNKASNGPGGALYYNYSGTAAPIYNCIFHNNTSHSGGGAIYCSYRINLSNSILVNNETPGSGGALYCLYPTHIISKIYNCVIANNKANAGGGLMAGNSISSGTQFFIPTKTIFYNNQSTNTNNYNGDVYAIGDPNFTLRLDGCSFTTDLTNATNGGPSVSQMGSIFNTDPLFINPSTGIGASFDGFTGKNWSIDFCTSPCVDASLPGDYGTSSLDYAGNVRKTNEIIDIGAYESYGFLSQPQDLEICEGEAAIFSSDYYYPGIDLNSSFWHISPDHGANWFAVENYAGDFNLSANTPVSSDSILVTLNHDFGCGIVYSDTVMLRVHPKGFTQKNISLCDGTYFVEGAVQSSSGLYYDTIQSIYGCDSIIETNLVIGTSFYSSNTIDICQGDSTLILGNYETTAGLYYDSLQTINGCDSVFHVQLTVNPIHLINQPQTICGNDSLYVGGMWQYSPGVYYDTLQTINTGCDSIIATTLAVNSISTFVVDSGFCNGGSITLGGTMYDQSGTYFQTLSNHLGCDSIVTYNISEYPLPNANIGDDTLWVCDGETLAFGLDDTTGIDNYYISNFTNTSYDDSLHFMYDMMNPVSNVISNVTDINGCVNNDQVIISNNNIINLAIGLASMNDPFVDFTIAHIPDNVEFWYWSFGDGDTLSANTTPTHEYNTNGTYQACLIGLNDCGVDSSCVTFTISTIGVQEQNSTINFNVYPNPAKDQLQIEGGAHIIKQIVIIDATGKIVKTARQFPDTINITDLPVGLYFVKAITPSGVGYQRFIKQ